MELKEQKQLVKEMIKTKNEEAKKQKNYLKVLILRRKNKSKEMAKQDLEEMLRYEEILNNTTLD